MGVNVVDANLQRFHGSTKVRDVDQPYGGNPTTWDHDDPPGGTVTYKVRYHYGSLSIDDTWSGSLSQGQFEDLADAQNQGAFDALAGGMMGGWYNGKPTEFKQALRDAVAVM